jgi:hypothetical protein
MDFLVGGDRRYLPLESNRGSELDADAEFNFFNPLSAGKGHSFP